MQYFRIQTTLFTRKRFNHPARSSDFSTGTPPPRANFTSVHFGSIFKSLFLTPAPSQQNKSYYFKYLKMA